MSCERIAIRAEGLGKIYQIFDRPIDRLKQLLVGGRRQYGRQFAALTDVSFTLPRGQVLGVIGNNGAGKSTLLQLLCKTLTPSAGSLVVNGRIAALLELGAGFNPEFSGRENIYLNGAVLGLSSAEIDARYVDIVEFSGIGDFIEQPVKTYSSGMYVRLAFAIATSVDPDILIIDEALSVGDGAFARKSFDRIMVLRERGATILFCSHSMYQIEAFCDQVIWLDAGRVSAHGPAQQVISQYVAHLDRQVVHRHPVSSASPVAAEGPTRIRAAEFVSRPAAFLDDAPLFQTGDDIELRVEFLSDPTKPVPTVGITILTSADITIASAGSFVDGDVLQRSSDGSAAVNLRLACNPFLKGHYYISVFLLCENGILVLDHKPYALKFCIGQSGLEQGVVRISHEWFQDVTAGVE